MDKDHTSRPRMWVLVEPCSHHSDRIDLLRRHQALGKASGETGDEHEHSYTEEYALHG